MQPLCLLILATLFVTAVHCDSSYIIETDSLPDDRNFMPTLGNGYMGFTVFGDSILFNGVYNGKGGKSHRARLPNYGNFSTIVTTGKNYTHESYKLDLYNGVFEYTQANSEIKTVIRTYPHRYFNRALITEIFVDRISDRVPEEFKLLVINKAGPSSDDFIEPTVTVKENGQIIIQCNNVNELENAEYQKYKPRVCIAIEHESNIIQLRKNETSTYKRIVIAYGEHSAIALKELNDVKAVSNDDLYSSHAAKWNALWKNFRIAIADNLQLERTINAGIFYLASSLPHRRTNQPAHPYFGLSPSGLGRGNLENDYQGHSFWDTEIWMLPVVTQLWPTWTRDLLDYRFRCLNAAMDNAKKNGFSGAQFPWESALTGAEVTNPCCPEIAQQQLHITADIAFGTRHYFIVTNDTMWMKIAGCELSRRIAEFWVDRVSLDEKTGQYDIKNVMGPDEDHENVTNNAYTNLVVHHALEFIHLTQGICEDPIFAAKCLNIAEKLKVPYDPVLDYHPQYDGYTPGTRIKQADAVLLSYPMLYPMNISTLANNLKMYENVTRATGPAMTWSMHVIGHLDVGDVQRAEPLFQKSYKDYVREPFKVWSEVIEGKHGAVNFITGVGGFLQTIVNGFGGVRFHSNRMEVRKPWVIPTTSVSRIHGIKYQGSTFTITLSSNPTITADFIKANQKLRIISPNNKSVLMLEGIEYEIEGTIYVTATMNY